MALPGSLGKRASAWLFRRRGRPPACHRRRRSPSRFPRAATPMVRRWAAEGGPEGRCRENLRPGQGQRQRQRSAADISGGDQRPMRSPGPDVHGHLRVVLEETRSRWDLRGQGV